MCSYKMPKGYVHGYIGYIFLCMTNVTSLCISVHDILQVMQVKEILDCNDYIIMLLCYKEQLAYCYIIIAAVKHLLVVQEFMVTLRGLCTTFYKSRKY